MSCLQVGDPKSTLLLLVKNQSMGDGFAVCICAGGGLRPGFTICGDGTSSSQMIFVGGISGFKAPGIRIDSLQAYSIP